MAAGAATGRLLPANRCRNRCNSPRVAPSLPPSPIARNLQATGSRLCRPSIAPSLPSHSHHRPHSPPSSSPSPPQAPLLVQPAVTMELPCPPPACCPPSTSTESPASNVSPPLRPVTRQPPMPRPPNDSHTYQTLCSVCFAAKTPVSSGPASLLSAWLHARAASSCTGWGCGQAEQPVRKEALWPPTTPYYAINANALLVHTRTQNTDKAPGRPAGCLGHALSPAIHPIAGAPEHARRRHRAGNPWPSTLPERAVQSYKA